MFVSESTSLCGLKWLCDTILGTSAFPEVALHMNQVKKKKQKKRNMKEASRRLLYIASLHLEVGPDGSVQSQMCQS